MVEYFDPSAEWQGKKYMFKCHWQTVNGEGYVWPVNSLVFHPVVLGKFGLVRSQAIFARLGTRQSGP